MLCETDACEVIGLCPDGGEPQVLDRVVVVQKHKPEGARPRMLVLEPGDATELAVGLLMALAPQLLAEPVLDPAPVRYNGSRPRLRVVN
jgi:hypothetical protein